jgi:hypothetical protein
MQLIAKTKDGIVLFATSPMSIETDRSNTPSEMMKNGFVNVDAILQSGEVRTTESLWMKYRVATLNRTSPIKVAT